MAASTLHLPTPHLATFSRRFRPAGSWIGAQPRRTKFAGGLKPVRLALGTEQLFLLDAEIVQKTFVRSEGESTSPNLIAGEIMSFFTRNNFSVSDRGETVTFEGMMIPNSAQAALLTFCTGISLGSVALVLSIAVPTGGNNWFWLMSLSPLAGVYYWTKASRKEEIKVKMMVGDDGNLTEIIVRGDDEQVEQMRKELKLNEKGMVYVKGIFEQ